MKEQSEHMISLNDHLVKKNEIDEINDDSLKRNEFRILTND